MPLLEREQGPGGIFAVNQQRANPRKPNFLDRMLGLYGADPNTHIPEDQRREGLRRGLRQGAMNAASVGGFGHDAPTAGQSITAFGAGMAGVGPQMGAENAARQRREMIQGMIGSGQMNPEQLKAVMMQLIAEGSPESLASAKMIGDMLGQMPEPGAGQFTLGEDQARYDAQGNLIVGNSGRKPDGTLALDEMEKIDTGEYIQFLDPESGDVVRSYIKGDSGELRRDFRADTKDFATVAEGVKTIESAFTGPSSAAGDLAGIFAYMKVLDPGSVVRESEFANAAAAAGAPERVKAALGRVQRGERLSEATRQDFLDRARRIAAGRKEQLSEIIDRYDSISRNMGVNPENVTHDYFAGFDFLKGGYTPEVQPLNPEVPLNPETGPPAPDPDLEGLDPWIPGTAGGN